MIEEVPGAAGALRGGRRRRGPQQLALRPRRRRALPGGGGRRRDRRIRRSRLRRGRCSARATSSRCPASRRPTRSCTPECWRQLERGFAQLRAADVSCESRRCGYLHPSNSDDAVIIHAAAAPHPAAAYRPPSPSHKARETLLQPVSVGHKALGDYRHLIGRALVEEIQELAEPLQGQAGAAPQRHGDGRRRVRDPLRAGAADARRRPRDGLAHHPRARGVLQRHEAAPQRAPGQPARADRGGLGDLRPLQQAERRARWTATTTTSSSTTPSRRRCASYNNGHPGRWIWRCHIDLSTPNMDVDGEDGADGRALRLQGLPPAGLRAQRGRRQGRDPAARDRPAVAEEHGALARGRRVRVRPVRRRRRPAADLPGVAFRPLEGPARRDRLPTGS